MTTATRTFDCPWCGAISPVPSDHLGEHFACPECARNTKLTPKNTSDRPPTAPPPGAPPTGGLRTFDCPWCGAISPIPASHLGERFACAECRRETKLTAANTQAAAVTAPPPGAPHAGRNHRGTLVAIGVSCLVVVGASFVFLRGSDDGTPVNETAREDGTPSMPRPPAAEPASRPESRPTPVIPAPSVAPEGAGDRPVGPPTVPSVSPPPATPIDRVALEADVATAAAALADANGQLATALAALTAEEAAVPHRREAAAAAEAFTALRGAVATHAATARTVETARAAQAALVAHIASDPDRMQRAERVRTWLATDLFGREVVGVTDWRGLQWTGPGVERALSSLAAEAGAAVTPSNPALVVQASTARTAVEEATRRLEEARRRLEAAGPDDAGAGPR